MFEKTKAKYDKISECIDVICIVSIKTLDILSGRVLNAIEKSVKTAPDLFRNYATMAASTTLMVGYSHSINYTKKLMLKRMYKASEDEYTKKKIHSINSELEEFIKTAQLVVTSIKYFADVYDAFAPPVEEKEPTKFMPIATRLEKAIESIRIEEATPIGIEGSGVYEDKYILIGGEEFAVGREAEHYHTQMRARVNNLTKTGGDIVGWVKSKVSRLGDMLKQSLNKIVDNLTGRASTIVDTKIKPITEKQIVREISSIIGKDESNLAAVIDSLTKLISMDPIEYTELKKDILSRGFSIQYREAEKILNTLPGTSDPKKCVPRQIIQRLTSADLVRIAQKSFIEGSRGSYKKLPNKITRFEIISELESIINMRPVYPKVMISISVPKGNDIRYAVMLAHKLLEYETAALPLAVALENYYIDKATKLGNVLSKLREYIDNKYLETYFYNEGVRAAEAQRGGDTTEYYNGKLDLNKIKNFIDANI